MVACSVHVCKRRITAHGKTQLTEIDGTDPGLYTVAEVEGRSPPRCAATVVVGGERGTAPTRGATRSKSRTTA